MAELPELPYAYNALEPHIDEQTMKIHHDKHHAGYVAKLNAALEKYPELASKTAEELIADLDALPEDIRGAVRNNGGGHANHSLFWQLLAPEGKGGQASEELKTLMAECFDGDAMNCKKAFLDAATTRFGSGWAWLVVTKDRKLKVYSTANQDSPIMQGDKPIIGLDVWEHAYYLRYQNKRPDYIEAWHKVINWNKVNELFEEAMK